MYAFPGIKTAASLAAHGHFAELAAGLRRRIGAGLYREYISYGLRRDLSEPYVAPPAKVPIRVRELVDSDVEILCPAREAGLSADDRGVVNWRARVIEARIPRCFVAVDLRTQEPCYIQWLIGAEHNEQIQTLGSFPVLRPDEALLENAYTPSQYRGMGIMSAAMALIAERAADIDARYVLTFVDHDNVASLKGCQRAGFCARLLRRERRYCFGLFRTLRFENLPDGFLLPYERRAAA